MKKILVIFILLNTFMYGEVFDKVLGMVSGDGSLKVAEQSVKFDEELLEKLNFSNEELKVTLESGETIEDRIKDLTNKEYTRWAQEVESVKTLSIATGPKRDTDNYVFKKTDEKYEYIGNYFNGDYTTGLTFVEECDETYVVLYTLDKANKELVKCTIFNKDIEEIGSIFKKESKFIIEEEVTMFSNEELEDIIKNSETNVLSFEDESYTLEELDGNIFVFDYNNDSEIEDMYLEYYKSDTFNTLDEVKVRFSNKVLDSYFEKNLGRVVAMKVSVEKDKVYMTFIEKDAFYSGKHYGNYVRVFLAEGWNITEVAKYRYREEKEFVVERK